MLLAGDERGRTQGGNNNAYCQDNEISWLDWSELSDEDDQLLTFAKRLIALRKAYPELRCPEFVHGYGCSSVTGLKEIEWLNADGERMVDGQWTEREMPTLGLLLDGHAIYATHGKTPDFPTRTLLALFNASRNAVEFNLPKVLSPGEWSLILDTANPESGASQVHINPGDSYQLPALTTACFVFSEHGDTVPPLEALSREKSALV